MSLITNQFSEFFTQIRKKPIIYADIKKLTEGVSMLITSPQILKKALIMIRKRVPEIEFRDQRSDLLVYIAEAFIKANNLKEAQQTAAEITDGYARDKVLIHIAEAFIKTKDFKEARQTATEIEDSDDQAAVLLNLVNALI